MRWWRTVRTADASYLMPDPEHAPRRLQDFKNLASDDLYAGHSHLHEAGGGTRHRDPGP